jgi:hypothetical protein
MAPAFGGKGLRRERVKFRVPRDTYAAARCDRRHCAIVPIKHDRFVGVAHEFGQGAECAEAPSGFGISKLQGEKIDRL